MSNDNIPMPDFLSFLFEGFSDPYPLNGDFQEPDPLIQAVIVNPGFSRKPEAWENAKRWAKQGHYVICYLPVESSTELGFDVQKTEQAGECERLTFHHRPYEGCRDIELIILDGRPRLPKKGAPKP